MEVTNVCLRCTTQQLKGQRFLFPKASQGAHVYVRLAVIQVTKLPQFRFVLWTCVMRNKWFCHIITHPKANPDPSQYRKKQFVNKTQSLYTKTHKCYNSGFKTNLPNCKTYECGSFRGSTQAVMSYDSNEEREWEKESKSKRERPDSINCFCEYVRRGGRVRAMKINHYPLEN